MAAEGIRDFLLEETETLAGAVIGVLLFAHLIVLVTGYWRFPQLTYTDIANLIIAMVAVSSLYIAWRELVRKTKPRYAMNYVDPDYREESDEFGLQIVNTGASVIIPDIAWYSIVQKDEEGVLFSTNQQASFDKVALEPGESATADIREDIVMFHLDFVYIRNWQGDSIKREHFPIPDYNRSDLADIGGDTQVKVQRLFDEILDSEYVGRMMNFVRLISRS